MDICKGGTVAPGATSITFTNHHPVACTITSCTLPGWPAAAPVVPAEKNGVPGELTVQLVAIVQPGTYIYTASCCKKGSSMPIKVQ
jgi:hypothetical protein